MKRPIKNAISGQWIGPYTGTNAGTLIVELDDVGDHYDGTVMAVESNVALPPSYGELLNVPKNRKKIRLRVPLKPVDRETNDVALWDNIKHRYPGITPPTYADSIWDIKKDQVTVTWQTDVQTSGAATLYRSRLANHQP